VASIPFAFRYSALIPSVLEYESVFLVISRKMLLTAVPPRSWFTPNSCNVADKPNTSAVVNPKSMETPPMRLAKSAITGAVAAPEAPSTFRALPMRRKSPAVSSVFSSFKILRKLPSVLVVSSTLLLNSSPSDTLSVSMAVTVLVSTSKPN